MKPPSRYFKTRFINMKIYIVFYVFILVNAAIIFKLYDLQIRKYKPFAYKVNKQHLKSWISEEKKGSIYDRNMTELAIDVPTKSLYVNPREIKDIDKTAKRLSVILKKPFKEVKKVIGKKKRRFVWIKRKLSPHTVNKVKRLNITGLYFSKEYKRYYPKNTLAANVLGFVGLDNQGLAGIEYLYEDFMDSDIKRVMGERDGKGRYVLKYNLASEDVFNKCDLVLTIDEVIQYVSQYELKKQIKKTRAKGGVVIVMDPHSGEVLSIANYPEFNPNTFAKSSPKAWLNNAVSSIFEPGSTMKIMLTAAAIEEKIIDPETAIYCENGKITIGGITIHDTKPHKILKVKDIIAKSSNVGAVKIGLKLGEEGYYKYIRKFGFGTKTNIDLPGEAKGVIRRPSSWSEASIGALSIGHEISVTPIQLLRAFSSVINGGTLVRPVVVKYMIESDKVIDNNLSRQAKKRVISGATSRIMIKILEGVVTKGTGKKAQVKGFLAGGKTGTTKKFDKSTGRYSSNKFIASFIGFVPVDNPKLAILVLLDEPQEGFYGGEVSAPVFSKIAERVLRYLNIPSSNSINNYTELEEKIIL